MQSMEHPHYSVGQSTIIRRGVGAVIFNAEGKIGVGKPIQEDRSLQMPQGGIEEGETAEQALFREMEEEVGSSAWRIVAVAKEWHTYYIPNSLRSRTAFDGQSQLWFLLTASSPAVQIDLLCAEPVFTEWKWLPIEQVIANCVSFKQPLYRKVLKEFAPYIEQAVYVIRSGCS